MKRHLVLEYRIRKLEKAILEDVDSDLDKMSDDILKRMPNDNLDAELDKRAKDIVNKEPGYFYHADEYGGNPKTFNTIDEWLDDKVFETEMNTEFNGDVVKRLNGSLKSITHLFNGLDTVRLLKKKIKEISNTNALIAQQKLVNALRKRIKEVEKNNSDNKKYEFDTIEDWLDSIVFNLDLSNDNIVKVLNDRLKDVSLNFVGGPVWYTSVNRLRKSIKEISNASLPVAQQKLVDTLRKRIKDIKNRKSLESLTYEGKQDQEILNDFLGDDYYNKYQTIKNRISDPEYKDIYKLVKKDPNEVKDYIDNFKSSRDKRASSKEIGARKIYEDSDWIVYHITDYSAAKYYGRDTKWCISGNYEGLEEVGQHEFEKYNSKSNIYFYINKHIAREKYCVLKNRSTGSITSIYDSKDYDLGKSLLFTDVDLPYVKEVGLNTKQQEDLFDAIRTSEGDIEDIEEYVNKDTVNAVSTNGNTPLMVAIGRNKFFTDITEFLIKNGADVNAKNNYNSTPLTIACESGNINMVKLLVKYGADVNNPMTEYGSGALLAADDKDIEEYLISKGAKIN